MGHAWNQHGREDANAVSGLFSKMLSPERESGSDPARLSEGNELSHCGENVLVDILIEAFDEKNAIRRTSEIHGHTLRALR
jgi:hypothetical protein